MRFLQRLYVLWGAYDLADLTTVRGALITVGGVLLGVFFGVDSLLIWVLRQT